MCAHIKYTPYETEPCLIKANSKPNMKLAHWHQINGKMKLQECAHIQQKNQMLRFICNSILINDLTINPKKRINKICLYTIVEFCHTISDDSEIEIENKTRKNAQNELVIKRMLNFAMVRNGFDRKFY